MADFTTVHLNRKKRAMQRGKKLRKADFWATTLKAANQFLCTILVVLDPCYSAVNLPKTKPLSLNLHHACRHPNYYRNARRSAYYVPAAGLWVRPKGRTTLKANIGRFGPYVQIGSCLFLLNRLIHLPLLSKRRSTYTLKSSKPLPTAKLKFSKRGH